MLKIAFLVAFCGLLVQMTQAEPIPANCMPVWVNPSLFEHSITKDMNPEYLVPQGAGNVTDPSTGAKLSSVTLQGPPTVNASVIVTPKGSLTVTCNGRGNYMMDLEGKMSQKGVGCNMSTSVQAPVEIKLTPLGSLKCGKMADNEDVKVEVESTPIRPGVILLTIIEFLINLLTSALQVLDNFFKHLIGSNVHKIMDSITTTLDGCFTKLCEPKDVGDGRTCTHTIMQKPTVDNNCMKLVVQSDITAPGGMPPSAPVDTYESLPIVPEKSSMCTFTLSDTFVNHALKTFTMGTYEVLEKLGDLSTKVQRLCGEDIRIRKFAYINNGIQKVKIDDIGITASATGKIMIYNDGSETPFTEAMVSLLYTGKVDVKHSTILLVCTFHGIGELKSVTKPNNCDVISAVSAALASNLNGTIISTCLGASPVYHFKLPMTTQCTHRKGYVVVAHMQY